MELTSDQRDVLLLEGFDERNEKKPGLFSKVERKGRTMERTVYIDLRGSAPKCYAFQGMGRKDAYPKECDRIISAVMAMDTQQTKLPLG
jgi:hypothetical protein